MRLSLFCSVLFDHLELPVFQTLVCTDPLVLPVPLFSIKQTYINNHSLTLFLYFLFLGTGLRDGWNMEGNGRSGRSRSPPIGLGAELGLGGSSQRSRTGCNIIYGFTILQLQELQLQSLIYKYIQVKFPVPYHLVLPVWKSVATSLGALSSGLYQLYPSCKSLVN